MTPLSPPEGNLLVSIVVPAHNEETLIRACLAALATQESISPEEYEVILVLDDCTDATELRARKVSRLHPSLRLHLLEGPGKGAGHARRVGMDTACQRLLNLGKTSSLIASTDADTVVAPDWLSTQLAHAVRGARAIGGRIELADDKSLHEDVAHWRNDRGTTRYQDLLTEGGDSNTNVMEHWQFSGASLSLTAEVYTEIGGLEPLAALEDEYLERVLRQRGIPIERPLAVKVKTSARQTGRADRGLAEDLALASWFHNNTYRASDFDVERLLQIKQLSISLILIREEHSSKALYELAGLHDSGLLDEILAINPLPGTNGRPAAVTTHRAEELMPHFGPIRGYGDILWRGLSIVQGDLVVVLDPEQEGDAASRICGLLGPLMEREDLALVKGFGYGPDQLSELVARPLVNLYHPKLAGFTEPLCPDFAGRRQLLRSLPFPVGPGVDISLLLDAAKRSGVGALAQCHLESRSEVSCRHDSETAYAILAAAASRAPETPSKEPVPGPLFLPSPGNLATRRVPVEERPPLESLAGARPIKV